MPGKSQRSLRNELDPNWECWDELGMLECGSMLDSRIHLWPLPPPSSRIFLGIPPPTEPLDGEGKAGTQFWYPEKILFHHYPVGA